MNLKKLIYRWIPTTLALTLSLHFNTMLVYATSAPSIVADSAILMDGDTGQVLYEKNPDRIMEPASLTKLLTALMAVEQLSPEDEITFSRTAVLSIEAGSSHIGLRENETITVNDAMHGLLLMSANEVANGIAETISGSIEQFCLDMNERAAELGAINTHFVNPNGLHAEDHTTTARDLGLITLELLKHPYFLEVEADINYEIGPTNVVDEIRYLTQGHKMMNEKKSPKNYREDVIAGKTGYTTKAGHTLVTVSENNGQRLISVILNTDANNLYADTNKLLDYGFEGFHNVTIDTTDFSKELQILGSDNDTATVGIGTDMPLLVPTGITVFNLTMTPNLPDEFLKEPSLGDQMGTLTVAYEDLDLIDIPLIVTDVYIAPEIVETVTPEVVKEPMPEDIGKKVSFGWIIPILAIIGLGSVLIFLMKLNKRKTMSYKDYKAMRDRQRLGHYDEERL